MKEKYSIVRVFIFSIVLHSSLFLVGQSSQKEYSEAKRQYGLGNYRASMLLFKELNGDTYFGEYASFYYALSALKLDRLKVAEQMFKQILVKYLKWDKKQEVDFWLAYIAFTRDDYLNAFRKVEVLPEDWRNYIIESFLGKMTFSALDSAYVLHPDNKYLANYLVQKIRNQPYEHRNQLKLTQLEEKFDISLSTSKDLSFIKKKKYAVAIILPFMFETLATPQTVIRNSIIFDLYQGMIYAQKQLSDEGINLEFFPFDTQKKGSVTRNLINSKKLDNSDVIIGPLYLESNKYINQFSKEKKITMINPLSFNGKIVDDNSFSYLFNSSYVTQGREVAKYAAKKFTNNKKLFIFYETDKDSIVARSYLETIKKEGFFVVRFDRLTKEDALQIQKDFTQQYEVKFNTTMYSQDEIDSIISIPEKKIRSRILKDEKTGQIVRNSEGDKITEYYEMKFTIRSDSIGHIFAATSNNLLANNLISLVEVRNDNIGIIGYEDWLDFSLISYSQLERLQVHFLSPSYIDTESQKYKDLVAGFISEIGKKPTQYHIYGYELLKHIGKMMDKHGKYFQLGWIDDNYHSGFMMQGLKYGIYRNNQIVPITTLKSLQLQNQNNGLKVEGKNED